MIDDLDRTIKELLSKEMTRVQAGQVDVAFHQPSREWRREGTVLNFFLYDVRENPVLRHHQWEEVRDEYRGQPLNDHQVMLKRSPLRIDCFYMVTAWSSDPIDEHRLLTECLMTLARHSILNQSELEDRRAQTTQQAGATPMQEGQAMRLPNGRRLFQNGEQGVRSNGRAMQPATDYLVGALQGLDYEIRTRLAFHDVMTNPAEVWGSLDNNMKAAFSYVVTLPIDPWVNLEQVAEAVGTATFKVPGDPRTEESSSMSPKLPATPEYQRPTYLGGVVKIAKPPAGGLEVWIVERGMSTLVDAQGRFVFRRVPIGEYTLEVRTVKEPRVLAKEKIQAPLTGGSEGHLVVIHIPPAEPGPAPAPETAAPPPATPPAEAPPEQSDQVHIQVGAKAARQTKGKGARKSQDSTDA